MTINEVRNRFKDYETQMDKADDYHHTKNIPKADWNDIEYLLTVIDKMHDVLQYYTNPNQYDGGKAASTVISSNGYEI